MNDYISKDTYNKGFLHYLNDDNISIIYDNLKRGDDPLNNIEDIDLPQEEKETIEFILINLAYKAEVFVSNLSLEKISTILSAIFQKIINECENGSWKYLSKKDILFIYNKADDNYKQYFNHLVLDKLPEYSSNAWNSAVCMRAILKWTTRLDIVLENEPNLYSLLKDARNILQSSVKIGNINKFPDGVSSTTNTTDYCFTYLMISRINNAITKSNLPLTLIEIDIEGIVEFLTVTQDKTGGWPDIVFWNDKNNYKIIGACDINATCYAMLLLKNDLFNGYKVEKTLEKGILYLLEKTKASPNGIMINGIPDIEASCLVFQVLNKKGSPYDNHKRILSFLKSTSKKTIKHLVDFDKDKLKGTLYLDNDEKIVRVISLLLITLLKSKMNINSPQINLPFAWLIKIALNENKANLIHILCCVSDYLEAERNYLVYGEEAIQKEVDFVV